MGDNVPYDCMMFVTGAQMNYQTAVNTAPALSAIADQVIPANTNTGALAFTVSDDSTPIGSISLNKSSSNTALVPPENIVIGGSGANRTVTVTPAAGQSGSAVISLIASDGSLSSTTTFTLTVQPPGQLSGTIYSDLADSAPRKVDGQAPDILSGTVADTALYAGRAGSGGSADRCVVYPFQLPSLGATATPFTSASFSFQLISNDISPLSCNLDLYALTNRNAATVLGVDYYSETNTPDPTVGTTRLQDNICVPTSSAGIYATSTASNTAMVNFLNTQYAGGANAGKFIFLRLNKDATVGTSTRKYLTTSANGASAANDLTIWPQIQYTAVEGNHAPTFEVIDDRTLIAGQTVQFTAQATDSEVPAQTLTYSLVSPPSGALIDPTSGAFTWRPTLSQAPMSHEITIMVTDDGTPALSASQSFQVIVQQPATPVLSVTKIPGGAAQLSIHGDAGPDYAVEASETLENWQPIWSNGSAQPPFEFSDPDAHQFNQRFYRVRLGP